MPKTPTVTTVTSPTTTTPSPPTAVDPAVIAARQNLINQQSLASRDGSVAASGGSNGQTLGQPVALGV